MLTRGNASPLHLPNVAKLRKTIAPLTGSNSDSDDLPEAGELILEEQKKQDQLQMQRKLQEQKQRYLAVQAATPGLPGVEDDGLEIVPMEEMQVAVKEEEVGWKSGKKMRITEGRKRQLMLGGIQPGRQAHKELQPDDGRVPFIGSVAKRKGKKGTPVMTQRELNETLVARVFDANKEETRKKEEEWARRGGKLTDTTEGALVSTDDMWKTYAARILKAEERRETATGADDGSSDEDWEPEMRGSISSSPKSEGDDKDEEGDEQRVVKELPMEEDVDADVTMVNPEDEAPPANDDVEDRPLKNMRPSRRALAIVDSDSDEQPNDGRDPNGTINSLVFSQERTGGNGIPVSSINHRGSLSSMDERTEDEGDKENNTRLMFDRSEDKENKAVVRHAAAYTKPLVGARKSSLFDLEHEIERGLSMSPVLRPLGVDADDEDDGNGGTQRFNTLLDADPFISPSRTCKPPSSFTSRLQQALPGTALVPLNPFIGKEGAPAEFPDQPTRFGGSPSQAGFSDLFNSGTEKQKSTPFEPPTGPLGGSQPFPCEVCTKDANLVS